MNNISLTLHKLAHTFMHRNTPLPSSCQLHQKTSSKHKIPTLPLFSQSLFICRKGLAQGSHWNKQEDLPSGPQKATKKPNLKGKHRAEKGRKPKSRVYRLPTYMPTEDGLTLLWLVHWHQGSYSATLLQIPLYAVTTSKNLLEFLPNFPITQTCLAIVVLIIISTISGQCLLPRDPCQQEQNAIMRGGCCELLPSQGIYHCKPWS